MAQSTNRKPSLLVVVWEHQNYQGRWRPYSPQVTQHLERAFSKNLRSVKLGDADPDLNDLTVVLSDMEQIYTDSEKFDVKKVRRQFYPQSSPAGQGCVWQWSGEKPGVWFTYDMCVQTVLEDAWTTGTQTVDLNDHFPRCPYAVDFCNLTQINKNSGYRRSVRRANQAGYPIARPNTPQQSNSSSHSPIGNSPRPSKQGVVHSPESDNSKRRSHKEDVDSKSKTEGGARSLLNKVGGLLHLGNSGSSDASSSSKPISLTSGGKTGFTGNSITTSNKFNGAGSYGSPSNRSNQFVHESSIPQHTHPLNRSKPTERRKGKPPVPKPRTMFPLHDDVAPYQRVPQHLLSRMDLGEEQFGSSATLNSDCSTLSVRRPSVETISTYLSQESISEDIGAHSLMATNYNPASNSRVDNLIQLDDSMGDDDVFAVDREVRDVFMKENTFSSSAFSDSNIEQSSESHFVPISSPTSDNHLNGSKRKRTNGKDLNIASSSPSQTSRSVFENNNYFSNFKMRKPQNDREKLLMTHTNKVLHPPKSDCSICMCGLDEISSDDDTSAGFLVSPIVSTVKCNHLFHEKCLENLLSHASKINIFLKCPNCNSIHGEKWGIQPKGTMKVNTIRKSLPSFNCNTFKITYHIPGGIQGPEHPNPGRPYHPVGFPRVAYIPDNEKGRQVLKLLKIAFDRRLVFTVGTSVTSGMTDCVTWNEIHHKTEWHNHSGHGYPDPAYLDNVLEELNAHGIF